jgi:hypothetical protein
MESAFSETRRAAELLQQFGGFPFAESIVGLIFITFFHENFQPRTIHLPAL